MEIKKKFFRSFSKAEMKAVDEMKEVMEQCYVQVPPFVIKRLIERKIIPDNLGILDDENEIIRGNLYMLNESDEYDAIEEAIFSGTPFEFNNEGIENNYSPYRVVFALERDGYTYFTKVAIPPKNGVVRIIDAWRKLGAMPFYPLPHQKELFVRGLDWDILPLLEKMTRAAKEGLLEKATSYGDTEKYDDTDDAVTIGA